MTEKLTSEEWGRAFTQTSFTGATSRLYKEEAVEAILTAHIAAAVAETRETVAREIEAHGGVCAHPGPDCQWCNYRNLYAAIARGAS